MIGLERFLKNMFNKISYKQLKPVKCFFAPFYALPGATFVAIEFIQNLKIIVIASRCSFNQS
jgi:hypothetical protein